MIEVDLLTEDSRLQAACEMYWLLDDNNGFAHTVKSISGLIGEPAHRINKLVNEHSVANSQIRLCKECDSPYVYKSRQDFLSTDHHAEWVCHACAMNQMLAYYTEIEKRLYDSLFTRADNIVDIPELSYRKGVLLLALLKFAATEDMASIAPYREIKHDVLTPDHEYSIEIINELFSGGYIAVDPDSDKADMILNESGGVSFHIDRVSWQVAGTESERLGSFYTELEEKIKKPSESDLVELLDLVDEISLSECIGYLKDVLQKHSLDFSPGEKTQKILKSGLEQYSVSQMYGFIWRAAKDSAAYYQRERIPRKQAANSAITRIEKGIERALSEGWTVQEYRRDYTKNQSALSRLVFNSILSTSDGGFHMSKAAITELIQSKIKAGKESKH